MNTDELERLLRPALAGTRAHFLGVYAADRAPGWDSLRPGCCYVMNTDRAVEGGEHWLAVFSPPASETATAAANANAARGPPELFDSFALPPSAYRDVPLLARHPSNLRLTPRPLQHPMSTVCGHYCVYFLYHRARGFSLTRIVSRLEALPLRDKYVRRFVSQLMRRYSLKSARHKGFGVPLYRTSPNQSCCSLHLACRIHA
jgi:hypothetical protein